MIVICCQCQRVLEIKPPYEDNRVSHGFCAACEAQLLSALQREAQQVNPRLA